MFQHARIDDADRLLDVGTGSGYGAALAARRLSDEQVTSVDVDLYLTEIARKRLSEAASHPRSTPSTRPGTCRTSPRASTGSSPPYPYAPSPQAGFGCSAPAVGW
ncbi:methyltransferase domain-containing protein [Streptomyces indonesiensis]